MHSAAMSAPAAADEVQHLLADHPPAVATATLHLRGVAKEELARERPYRA